MKARGIALITGLLLLAALSLLALLAASGMILQNHMASNFAEESKARENSGIAVSEARAWLYSRANHERQSDCTRDCLLPVAIHPPGGIPDRVEYEGNGWWQLNAIDAGMNPVTGEISTRYSGVGAEPPRWTLEEIHFQSLADDPPEDGTAGVGYYRILGRGTGTHSASVAVTEAIFARPWGDSHIPDEFPAGFKPNGFCLQFDDLTHPQLECGLQAWRQRR